MAISLIWDSNKPAKLQFFAWQVASGEFYTGSQAIHLGYPGDCVRCRSGLLETDEHCLGFCSFSRSAWTWARGIRKAFGMYELASWKELAFGIKPGSSRNCTPHSQTTPPIAAWDVFRVALLWRIWCARCKVVFKADPYTVTQTCQLAWMDTIQAGMARIRHLTSTYLLYRENGRTNVFCTGSFSSP
jgi:hypothetical protein